MTPRERVTRKGEVPLVPECFEGNDLPHGWPRGTGSSPIPDYFTRTNAKLNGVMPVVGTGIPVPGSQSRMARERDHRTD